MSDAIHLVDQARQGSSGRLIPLNKELKAALVQIQQAQVGGRASPFVVTTERATLPQLGGYLELFAVCIGLWASTAARACILVLKKCKKPDDVLFINAAEHSVKGKRQNQLTDEHIAKIIRTYQFRKEADRYSKRIGMERIAEEAYNLNISRYVSTAEQGIEIDLSATHDELIEIEKRIRDSTANHNSFLKELGLSLLPGTDQ